VLAVAKMLHQVYEHIAFTLPAAQNADAIIATSDQQRIAIQRICRVPEEKVYTVYNGIDVSRYSPEAYHIRDKLGLMNEDVLILVVARLIEEKGVQFAIRSFPLILERVARCRLLIVGDGNFRSPLEKMAQQIGLSSHILFVGTVPEAELPSYYASADVFVNSTIRANGYDLTIVQAMACGKPVVVSNIGSVPTLIADGKDGLLVPPGDIVALAERVKRVLSDPGLAKMLGRNARKKVVERFSLEAMAKGTLRVYERVLQRRKS